MPKVLHQLMIAAAFVILLSSSGAWNGRNTLVPRSDKARATDWTVASLIASSVAITCIPNKSNAADQPRASLFLLIPGYRLGNSSFYKPFEQDFGEAIGKDHSRASFVFIDEDGTDDADLTRSAEAIQRSINFHDFDTVCIAGHSRGGAVATSVLAALLGGKLKKGGQDKLKKGSTLGLLLIDPVDDGATTSLRQLSQTLEELGSSTPVPVKTLIVSTSFGGYSSYYKTKIANACAPEQRNAPAFRDSFAKLRLASGMTYLDAPELGHLQLLDEAVLGSPYSSACARNAAPVEGRRQKVHEQISLWLRSLFS